MIRGDSRYRRVYATTESGLPYSYWTRDMPPISDKLLGSVVYLYPTREAARAGEKIGGSGFMTSVPLIHTEGGITLSAHYIVTNRHVAEKASVARALTYGGETEIFDTPAGGWYHHSDGDDVSVFPLVLPLKEMHRFTSIPWSLFITSAVEVDPGEDVFFLGRFINVEGAQRNAPVVRFGHLAMQQPQQVPTDRGISQESFLVEMLSLSGYSGSPALAFRMHMVQPFIGEPKLTVGPPRDPSGFKYRSSGLPALLGIDWGHIHEEAPVRQPDGTVVSDKLYVRQNSGIAGVVPAWKIAELLREEELEEMRATRREEIEREREEAPPTTLDSADDEGSEFERFEDLTRKLVNTPKEEIDKKRRGES
jgi:hypothetical protein